MILFGWHVWRGESGRRYRFKITLTRGGIPDYGGIYVFVRRQFVFFLTPVYVGKATNFRERLYGHEKFAKAVFDHGVTERHVMQVATEADRSSIEEDLIRALKPRMNDVMMPKEGKARVTKPVGFGWTVKNWLVLHARKDRDEDRKEARQRARQRAAA
jgi:hypothetical protein